MKVRMLRNTFIAGELAPVGQVIEVDSQLALLLLNARKAEPVLEDAETATMEPGEQAVKPRRTRRRKEA